MIRQAIGFISLWYSQRLRKWSFVVFVVVFCLFAYTGRRHSEIQTEAGRKVAALESSLQATIRKYEKQLHSLQADNERLRRDLASGLAGSGQEGRLRGGVGQDLASPGPG